MVDNLTNGLPLWSNFCKKNFAMVDLDNAENYAIQIHIHTLGANYPLKIGEIIH